jgi:hypothetical protein
MWSEYERDLKSMMERHARELRNMYKDAEMNDYEIREVVKQQETEMRLLSQLYIDSSNTAINNHLKDINSYIDECLMYYKQ